MIDHRAICRVQKPAYARGFTIVELLIVIVVIAVLAALVIVSYNGISRRAAESSLKSSLRSAATKLASDNVIAGAYPATLAEADEGRGLSAQSGTVFEYTYTAAINSYCLTARSTNSSVAPQHIGSSGGMMPQTGACAGHGVTDNLVVNGEGDMGSNTNFSSFTYDSSDSAPVGSGSFAANTGGYSFLATDQDIAVEPTKRYILRGWGRQRTAGVTTARWYLGLSPRDISGYQIQPQNYMYRPGTTTTLAQPLNPGDTVVYLTNISTSWYDTAGTATHFRSFVIWGYTDAAGTLWPMETYTRNPWYSDIYNGGVGAIDRTNNTITLNKPWPGGSYPAGRAISNGGAGSSYMYAAASNELLTDSWQERISPTITGTTPGGLNSSTTSFPVATKSVRISIGINAGSPPITSRPGIGGIRFYEIQ